MHPTALPYPEGPVSSTQVLAICTDILKGERSSWAMESPPLETRVGDTEQRRAVEPQ